MKHLKELLKASGGFTMIELVVVMAIIAVLAGLVAGAMGGIGASGQNARLAGDRDAIGKAADRFFNDSFPQTYPVVSLADTDDSIKPVSQPYDNGPTVDFGVRLIDFDARLPQNPLQVMVPDYVKGIPDSAALVSWRIDTNTGNVFFSQDGAVLARPSASRLDVRATSTALGAKSTHTFTQRWKKGGSAQEVMTIEIPAGYSIGGQTLADNVQVGTFTTEFAEDNPWAPGQPEPHSGTVLTTGVANEWEAVINFGEHTSRVYKISIAQPSSDTPGKMKIVTDRTGVWDASLTEYPDTDFEESSGTWVLTIYGTVVVGATTDNIITNPSTKGVYRWLAKEHTATDVKDYFQDVAGNQAVVIK